MMKYFTTLFFVPGLLVGMACTRDVLATGAESFFTDGAARFTGFFIRDLDARSNLRIYKKGGFRYIESDGLPDHATGKFPNADNAHAIAEQTYKYRVPLQPERRRSPTFIRHATFGVAVNGIPFEPATEQYWNNDPASNWNIDAMHGSAKLGLDQNHAHVQANGAYHYHGIPTALMERADQFSKPVLLGYAADGFPIYGPYSYAQADEMSSELINLFPSYRIKAGLRSGGPGGKYDGRYTADYEFVKGLGDLDQCNGRLSVTPEYPDGTYYYVITDAWPFIPRCWMGKPDPSFLKVSTENKKPAREKKKQKTEQQQQKQKKEKRQRIDTRKYGVPARNALSACAGRRSGTFCSYRGRDLRTVNGTCRSAGATLVCRQIGR